MSDTHARIQSKREKQFSVAIWNFTSHMSLSGILCCAPNKLFTGRQSFVLGRRVLCEMMRRRIKNLTQLPYTGSLKWRMLMTQTSIQMTAIACT